MSALIDPSLSFRVRGNILWQRPFEGRTPRTLDEREIWSDVLKPALCWLSRPGASFRATKNTVHELRVRAPDVWRGSFASRRGVTVRGRSPKQTLERLSVADLTHIERAKVTS